jgi:hypothetical protein
MNAEETERLHALAQKARAKTATPAEHRELGALLAERLKVKEPVAQMGGDAMMVRELLPLLEGLNEPSKGIPDRLMKRLDMQVGAVIEANKRSRGEVDELLVKLEEWAGKQTGAGREEGSSLVGQLRGRLLEGASWRVPSKSATPYHAVMSFQEALRWRVEAQKTYILLRDELERSARALDERLRELQASTQGCREEVQRLLKATAHERKADEESRGPHPLDFRIG